MKFQLQHNHKNVIDLEDVEVEASQEPTNVESAGPSRTEAMNVPHIDSPDDQSDGMGRRRSDELDARNN